MKSWQNSMMNAWLGQTLSASHPENGQFPGGAATMLELGNASRPAAHTTNPDTHSLGLRI